MTNQQIDKSTNQQINLHISIFFQKLCTYFLVIMRERLSTSYVWLFFLLIVGSMSAQQIEISGTVKDDKVEPLLGVFILVKGTQRGATTDF